MMRMISYSFVAGKSESEDEIDQLFSYLPQMEAPDELIARIIAHIGHLPVPQIVPPWSRRDVGAEALIVRNEGRAPS